MLKFSRKSFESWSKVKSWSFSEIEKSKKVNEMSDNSMSSCNKNMNVINQVKKQVSTVKNDAAAIKNALEVICTLGWVIFIVWGEVCCLFACFYIFVS